MAQLALSAKQSDTTKVSPFFANFGKDPNLFEIPRNHKSARAAIERMKTLERIHDNISRMQGNSARYQNKKRKMTPQLKKGDKVYLLTKNLRYKKKDRKRNRKLDSVKVESFFIKVVKGPVNYELNLPKDVRVYPVFHIFLLEPADSSTPIQERFHYELQEEDEFVVEEILEKKGQKYLVK